MSWLESPFVEIDVKDVYNKDEKLKKEDVDTLKDWLKKTPHLPPVTELQIVLFLHSCYYNIELSKRTIDVYFTTRTLSQDIFGSRTIRDPALSTALKCGLSVVLPELTPKGEAVIMCKLMHPDSALYDSAGQFKMFDVCTHLYLHKRGPAEAVQMVMDMDQSTFGHLLKVTPSVVRRTLYYLQEGMPIRLKCIHIINVVPFLDKALALIKPFMKKELYDSIKIHSDIRTLYEYVPKDMLPSDYGGSCESASTLHGKLIDLISNTDDFHRFQESQLIDKSKRPKLEDFEQSLFGASGSFKKLEVD
ncbi:unnamed protein product [Phyllotreta striolata]|uniref:CRAL-TRIO domain-containing protein n=1 Tax=Phyllotreta striolata TaxID=444603 RepID=A0A9N9TMB3_PHYSR|nr:unnamed protein product [Phyllotreta striolata]